MLYRIKIAAYSVPSSYQKSLQIKRNLFINQVSNKQLSIQKKKKNQNSIIKFVGKPTSIIYH